MAYYGYTGYLMGRYIICIDHLYFKYNVLYINIDIDIERDQYWVPYDPNLSSIRSVRLLKKRWPIGPEYYRKPEMSD